MVRCKGLQSLGVCEPVNQQTRMKLTLVFDKYDYLGRKCSGHREKDAVGNGYDLQQKPNQAGFSQPHRVSSLCGQREQQWTH